MNKTITALCTALLLTGCMSQSPQGTQHVEPKDVTNIERELVQDCTKRLTQQWPANEPVVLTTLVRESHRKHTIGINFAFTMNQAAVDKVVKQGVKNQGWCEYEDNRLVFRNWIANVDNIEKLATFGASGYGEFK